MAYIFSQLPQMLSVPGKSTTCFHLSTHPSIRLLFQQVCAEDLLCAGPCARHQNEASRALPQIPALQELELNREEGWHRNHGIQ